MSPASRVISELMYAISWPTEKIIMRVVSCCMTSPLSRVVNVNACGSGMSEARTISGPTGAKPSSALPAVHCVVRNWMSRALMSLKTV